ncbi:hypothetical protein C5167_050034 [Papaver somniferum]|uniref:Uncharacterized protein n=1 Tax=Papaver somniferum TaxID=3469 RepID=A0A4Y7KMH8_PAPSO|nr:hypothetical protein C5167_050034 [Papaver somniferum]
MILQLDEEVEAGRMLQGRCWLCRAGETINVCLGCEGMELQVLVVEWRSWQFRSGTVQWCAALSNGIAGMNWWRFDCANAGKSVLQMDESLATLLV